MEPSKAGRLAGKVCLITGGARGIGAATALMFAHEGASVAIADLKDDLGEQVAQQIVTEGGQAVYRHCDVTSQAAVAKLVGFTMGKFGRIDVLFNNAGTAIVGSVESLSAEDWDLTFAINTKSMFLCSKFVIPLMRQNGGGSIIHMGSESGLVGLPMHPAYCASKGAVINLTRSMAVAHAADGIRVNCLCPGSIRTELFDEVISSLPTGDEVLATLKREHPLGFGTANDIAQAALYLASDESRYMTGSPLIVDGGYTAK